TKLERQLNRLLCLSRWILAGVVGALAVLVMMVVTWAEFPEMRLLESLSQVVSWLRDAIPHIVTWPVVVGGIVLYLGYSRVAAVRLSSIFGRFQTLKLLGAELSFSEEGARRLATNADEIFDEFRRHADMEFQRQARVQGLRRKLEL